VQACVQCGLSIGEAATFCPVCGTRVGDGAAPSAAAGPGASLAPASDPVASLAEAGPAAPETAETRESGTDAETQPSPEPAAELVTELEADSEQAADADLETDPEPDLEAARLDAVPVTGNGAILEAQPEADHAELVADLASERTAEAEAEASAEPVVDAELEEIEEAEAAAEPEETEEVEAAAEADAPEPEESADDVRLRRMTEIAALLEFAGRCEEVNAARAAVVYGEAIVACLDVSDDPLGAEPVREDLLRGFDGLSLVLERQGLSEEALAVVDDAASLGLLDRADGQALPQQDSLRDRREGLRRILYGDSAQL
jgi:hypothetical protein